MDDSSGKQTPDYCFSPRVEKAFCYFIALILFAELLVLFGNTLLRNFTGVSIHGALELAEFSLTALAFIGGAYAYHCGMHLSVTYFVDLLPAKLREYAVAAKDYLILIIGVIGVVLAVQMIQVKATSVTAELEISQSWTHVPFLIGMALLTVFAANRLVRTSRRTSLVAGGFVLALTVAWFLAQLYTGPWKGGGALLFAMILLFALVFAGIPIAFVLNIVAYVYMYSSRTADIIAVPFAMKNGIGSFVLLAVPFFILAGNIMTEGGLTKPLADWVRSLVGHFRGGLMQSIIPAIFIFSGISGAKVADIAAVGTAMRGMLKDEGYEPAESTAAFSGAVVMSETVPPSLIMMVLGSITTLSVGTLFVAGVVPAIFIAICLMGFIAVRARLRNWPCGEKASWSLRFRLTLKAFPALLVPVILVVGIVSGYATPTEVSSFAVVYSILISVFIYRYLGLGTVVDAFTHAAVSTGMILMLVGTGSALSWTLTIAGLLKIMTAFFNSLGGSSAVFLIASIFTMILMGAVLEGMPALLIFGPMLLTAAVQFGINQIHLGLILIISMGIGTFLPPFGICFFVSCSVLESTMEAATPRLLPYLAICLFGLIFLAFNPWFSLALPQALHMSVH